MHNSQLNYFKKKKNRTIFIISFSFSLLLTAIIIILVKKLSDNDLVLTIYFVALIAYLIFVVYIRTKLIIYNMNYNYYLMINDNLGLIDITRKLYTKSWLNSIYNDGYKIGHENDNFILYYQFFKKLKNLGRTGYTLVAIVVSKKENYNFFENNLNIYIERLYNSYEYQHRVKKQIIIQFKKYESYEEAHKQELQELINFKNGELVDINIPVGYFVNENKVYLLRPLKKYFNKFHFFATNLALKFSNVKGDNNGEEE